MELMKLLLHGDCLEKLKLLKENSIDSIVTDPPYGISFMNKKWDYDVPSVEIWTECLRVLKPGGHLLSFGGSRTYHRMAVRIEDAGFEIRDQIMWIYGSGFPKSHNIGKAVDKLQGNEREVVGVKENYLDINNNKEGDKSFYDSAWLDNKRVDLPITKGQSEWEGWGTALKPAHEPIVVARKPLSEKSVAENVLKWGTGGLNIDVSRIGTDGGCKRSHQQNEWPLNENGTQDRTQIAFGKTNHTKIDINEGRWPANIILDEEAGQVLDEQSGISTGKVGMTQQSSPNNIYQGFKSKGDTKVNDGKTDKGGASRFFYCPKTSKKDRNEGCEELEEKGYEVNFKESPKQGSIEKYGIEEALKRLKDLTSKNNHPTVKPTSLMEYLIKLVTPVNGTVLDPFMGSGSTGKASVRNGFDFIGIEREEEYIKIAEARIKNELNG